jgi:aspartate/methionine/tyrosine aminotransferase
VERWCEQTAERSGVLVLPGSVYAEPRHVRFGFGRANLAEAIERLDSYMG